MHLQRSAGFLPRLTPVPCPLVPTFAGFSWSAGRQPSPGQRFFETALATLDSKPFLGVATTFPFFVVVVVGVARDLALGFSAKAFGVEPAARLRIVEVGIFAARLGIVGVVGAGRPNTEVVVTGTFVVDDARGNDVALVVEVPVVFVAEFAVLFAFESELPDPSRGTTLEAGVTVVVVVGSGAATSNPV